MQRIFPGSASMQLTILNNMQFSVTGTICSSCTSKHAFQSVEQRGEQISQHPVQQLAQAFIWIARTQNMMRPLSHT